jgi:hypothetical protein
VKPKAAVPWILVGAAKPPEKHFQKHENIAGIFTNAPLPGRGSQSLDRKSDERPLPMLRFTEPSVDKRCGERLRKSIVNFNEKLARLADM